MHMKEDNIARKIQSTAQAEKEKEKKRIPRVCRNLFLDFSLNLTTDLDQGSL